jgi:hypothetical protein
MTQRGRTSASSSIFSTGRADRCGGVTQLRGGGSATQQKKEEDSANILEQSMGARNRVGNELSYRPAGLCSLAGQYDNPIPTRFLASIDFSKIPELEFLKSLWGPGTEEE